jgi:hypothetical protein
LRKIVIYNEKPAIIFQIPGITALTGLKFVIGHPLVVSCEVFNEGACERSPGKIFIASGKIPNPRSFNALLSRRFLMITKFNAYACCE